MRHPLLTGMAAGGGQVVLPGGAVGLPYPSRSEDGTPLKSKETPTDNIDLMTNRPADADAATPAPSGPMRNRSLVAWRFVASHNERPQGTALWLQLDSNGFS